MRISLLPWIFLIAVCVIVPSFAQTGDPPQPSSEDLNNTGKEVEVSAVADKEITSRIQGILETTSRYEALSVRVENGVVFLEGQTTTDEFRIWARDLALRIEDTVAVVNNISVVSDMDSIWNFEPAMDQVRDLWRMAIRQLPLILFGILILFITVIVASLSNRIASAALENRVESKMMRTVMTKIIVVIIWILGIYVILRVIGMTRLAMTALGGTGVLGLIIGFGFRDIAENFLSSLLISIQKPFSIGDTIEVAGYTGIVQKVTTRGTVLMAFDGNYIQLSNSTIYKSTIRNFTANPKTRVDFSVGIGYDADITEVQDLLLGVVQRHPAVFDDPEPKVFVENLGASTIGLHVYFWIDIIKFSQLKVRSSVIRQSVDELLKAGIPMPDDSREVIFPDGVPVKMIDKEAAPKDPPQAAPIKQEDSTPPKPEASTAETEEDLKSETSELQEQANEAGLPEGGRDILSSK